MLLTTTTLLNGLHDTANDGVWRRFDSFYRPFLLSIARRHGLSDADAEDAVQNTLSEVQRAYTEKYDRKQGRLRAWVTGVAKRQIASRRRANRRARGFSSDVDAIRSPAEFDRIEAEEWNRAIARTALAVLCDRSRCRLTGSKIAAFRMVVLEGATAQAASAALAMSVDDVFRAKYLCLRYLRKCRNELEKFYQA